MDDLTVLMTTYNEEKQVFEMALNSILNQTLKDFKILIVVDNLENTFVIDVIKKYAEKDNRISYIINETNLRITISIK